MRVTTILVPGLRGPNPDHWQEILAGREPDVVMLRCDRAPLDVEGRIGDVEAAVTEALAADPDAKVVVVAHSAGCAVTAQWAARAGSAASSLAGLLFVTPPTLRAELPPVYPRLAELQEAGLLPLPASLPLDGVPTLVAQSDDDPLGPVAEVADLAVAWDAHVHRLGAVGHANPASGCGDDPRVLSVVREFVENAAALATSAART